ncbi:NACHT, LRR and PYD domains-containing protein 3-like [Pyxicephalus adspersus]|uniref:NACHT, LRR and PYD domains-containing protein 3-like n=1 Tax=Pyxicephalus adspersus TaxID=30357 RepID=UPI003B5ABC40
MGQTPSKYSGEDGEKIHELLSDLDFKEIKLIYEYFKHELIYIVKSIHVDHLLEFLSSRNILDKELYLQMEKDLEPFEFSEKLVGNLLDAGKEAVIGFWDAIYDHQLHCSSDNLYTQLREVDKLGDGLMQQIFLEINEHPLTSELKEIQKHHRQHLLEKNIPRPSGSTGKNEFYVSNRYMDMIASYVRPFNRPSEHKLIETARKHEEYLRNELETVPLNRLFSWCHMRKCTPHAVMVTGVPGIGKTTLLQKLVCDWANGKFYQRFSFIFFLKFQDLNKLENMSLESMILQEYPYLEDQLGNILQNPERLLFIFDGLDESVHEINFKSSQICHDIKQVGDVGAVVVGLVRQSLLKGCSLLFTSQPDKLAGTDISDFQRVLAIVGFLPKERQLYIERFFMNKGLSDQVFSFLKENGVLYTFCYNPSYCWIICTVLSMFFKDQPTNDHQIMSSPPKTLTQLFAAFIARVLSNTSLDKISTRSLLTSVGWMAEHGVMNHITKFDKQTLAQFDVDMTSKLLPTLMKESTSSPEPSFSFLHPITQEFLAAVVYYIDYSPENLQSSLEKAKSYKNNRGDLFISFLCGLSDNTTRTILEPYLGDLSSDAAQEVLPWLNEYITEFQTLEKEKHLNVFFNFFEIQNKDLVLECLGTFRKFDLGGVHLTPLDCSVLTFILQSCGETEEFHLNGCKLRIEDIRKFAPALHTVHYLDLVANNIGDDGMMLVGSALKHPKCKIQNLLLSDIGLTDRACSYLGPAITDNQTLRTLILSYNKLEGPHFGDLMTALSSPNCKLEELFLNNTHLTDSSCSALASGIRNNRSLKLLYLSWNYLIGPHFGDLMEALSNPNCTVEQLMLQDILLQDEHLPSVVLLSNNKNLTHLELSNNSLTGAATPYLRDLILQSPNLKEISLFSNHKVPYEDRRMLVNLKTQKPGLRVSID